jgi:hypothetical protein
VANYTGNLQDRLGQPVALADVYVYLTGTNTLAYQTQTNVLGSYSIPSGGSITNGVAVDLVFSGGDVQTIKRPNIILFP